MVRTRAAWRSVVSIGIALALTACGGGGGGGSSVSPQSPVTPPSTSPSSAPTVAPPVASASGTIAISVPRYVPASSTSRAPKFVSPATQSVSITLVTANGNAPATPYTTQSDLTSTSPNCTSSSNGLTCSIPVNLPVGTDVLTLKTYTGTALSGTQIGTATTPVTIVQNARNTLGVSISGVVATLAAFASNGGSFASGAAATTHLYVVALDSTGNIILGSGTSNPTPTYDNPLTITTSPTTSAFKTVATGTTTSKTTITGPGDLVDIAYSGATTGTNATFTITGVTGTGGTPTASIAVSAGTTPLTASIASSSVGPSIGLTTAGSSTTVTLTGGTPPYTASASGVASVSGTSPTFTVTGTTYGSGTVTFTDAASATVTRSVSVQSATPVTITRGASSGSSGTSSLITMASSNSSFQAITLSGGDGTNYAVTVAGSSGGTGTSSGVLNASGGGSTYTITPTGLGTDYVVVKSGGQTATLQVNVTTSGLAVRVDTQNQASWNYGTSVLYVNKGFPGQGSAAITPIGGSGQYATTLSITGSCSYVTLGSLSSGSYSVTSPSATGTSCFVTPKDATGVNGPTINIIVQPVLTVTQSQSAIAAVTFQGTSGTQPVTVSGGSGNYSCFSGNGSVATFSCTGSSGTVGAVGAGGTLLAVNDTTSTIQVSIPVYVGSGGGFTVSAPSGSGVVAASDVSGRLHLAMRTGSSTNLNIVGGNGTVNNPTGTCTSGTAPSVIGSGSSRTIGASLAATGCSFAFSDQLGQLAPFSVDVYNTLVVSAATVSNVTYITDTHGYASTGTGYQLEFLGTGSVAEIDVAQSSLAGAQSCGLITATSGSDSVAKVDTSAGGSFANASASGFGVSGSSCQIFVKPIAGGYGRLTITDGNILTTGDQAATQTSLGVGVTTVTIPVLDHGRAR